jgi:hypothetical protein
MDADELLERVGERYQTFSTYQDSGVVLSYRTDDQSPREIVFTTWFVRPNYFRFDWRDHHPYPPLRHIVTNHSVRSSGTSATYRQDNPHEVTEERDLGLAIAGATGISSAAACDVPNLLMPEVVRAFKITQLLNLEIVGTSIFEGTSCIQVRGQHPRGGEHELWIGEADFLVRNFRKSRPGRRADQIHRNIVVDQPIPEAVFSEDAAAG